MKQILQLGALSTTNIASSFIFQWYVITQLGVGVQTDALFAGMTLPQLVLVVIGGSIANILVPLLACEDDHQQSKDVWGIVILVGSFFGLLSLILYMTAQWWVPFTIPGFNEYGKTLTIKLTRLQLVGVAFAAINNVLIAYFHARQHFKKTDLISVFSNIVGLLLLYSTLEQYGVEAAAWIANLRILIQTFLLAIGVGIPVFPNLRSTIIQTAWERIKPIIIGSAYYKSEIVVDRYLLSSADSGILSLYYFAQQIYGAASQVIGKAIGSPTITKLSLYYKHKNEKLYQKTYYNRLRLMGIIVGASIIVLFGIGDILLGMLVGHGNINEANVNQLWYLLIFLCGVLIGGAMAQVTSASFYVKGLTKKLTLISVASYTIFTLYKITSYNIWGIKGLAMATSAYYIGNFLIQMGVLRRMENQDEKF